MPPALKYLSRNCLEIFPRAGALLTSPIVISRKDLPFLAEPTSDAVTHEVLTRHIAEGMRAIIITLEDEVEVLSRTSIALAVAEASAGVPEGRIELVALFAGPGAALSLPWRHLPTARLAAIGFVPHRLETFWGQSPFTKVNSALDVAAGNLLLTAAHHHLPAVLSLEDDQSRFHTRWHGFTHHLS